MENLNVVLVKHPNCDKHFMFEAPKDVRLFVGDRVLCQTKRSPLEMGTCISASFEIMDYQLEDLWKVKKESLEPVVGLLKPQMFVYQKRNGANDENG